VISKEMTFEPWLCLRATDGNQGRVVKGERMGASDETGRCQLTLEMAPGVLL
jgi:hypothetical protein